MRTHSSRPRTLCSSHETTLIFPWGRLFLQCVCLGQSGKTLEMLQESFLLQDFLLQNIWGILGKIPGGSLEPAEKCWDAVGPCWFPSAHPCEGCGGTRWGLALQHAAAVGTALLWRDALKWRVDPTALPSVSSKPEMNLGFIPHSRNFPAFQVVLKWSDPGQQI